MDYEEMKLEERCTYASIIKIKIDSTTTSVGIILLEIFTRHDSIIECLKILIIFNSKPNKKLSDWNWTVSMGSDQIISWKNFTPPYIFR